MSNLHKIFFIIFAAGSAAFSFSFSGSQKQFFPPAQENIKLAFITYNGNGNNLYLDNVAAGKRPVTDLAITSFNNIPPGTILSRDSSALNIVPSINIVNLGTTQFTNIILYLSVPEAGYFDSTLSIPVLNAGAVLQVNDFDTLTLTPGVTYNITVTSNQQDTIASNSTLSQQTLYLPGSPRRVLFQEFTGALSSASAVQNIPFNNFINGRFDSIVAIKYHRGIPPPARDSMYLSNTAQSDSMRDYYNSNGIPNAIADGTTPIIIPFGTQSNLYGPYAARLSLGSPLSIDITDTRLPGDSIRADININILYSLPPGDYRLKVAAIERQKMYSPKPSGWFDSVFYDVFRKAYPGINGVSIPTAAGSYQYSITYLREQGWADSSIYTAAYVQENNTREVINSNKARHVTLAKQIPFKQVFFDAREMFDYEISPQNLRKASPKYAGDISAIDYNYAELFEGPFVPEGWRISNPDGSFTFAQISGANGPFFGGVKSIKMPFYDYIGSIGQRDTIFSPVYTGLQYNDTLKFDYAYALYGSGYIDSLTVLMSLDGGSTYNIEVFRKGGQALATSTPTTQAFFPNLNQWRTFVFPLQGIVGVQNISSEIPGSYELKQNYPNPFNPATKIEFNIPEKAFVKIKIFDITGREIASLVNRELSAGVYKADFDGSTLSTGIYFYRLETEKFSEVKKMVLVK